MAAMKSATVKIPVALELSLKDISSQIASMKKMLGSIVPKSDLYANLKSQISALEKKYRDLSVISKDVFSTPSQIKTFEKKLSGLEGGMREFLETLQDVNFHDLNLTGDQLATFDELDAKIKSLETRLEELDNKKIKDILSPQVLKDAFKLGIGEDTSFKEASNKVVEAYKNANEDIKNLTVQYNDLAERKKEIDEKIGEDQGSAFQSNSKKALNELYDTYTKSVKNNGDFKNQGEKPAFIAQAEKIASEGFLSPEELERIKAASGKQLEDIFIELEEKRKDLAMELLSESNNLSNQMQTIKNQRSAKEDSIGQFSTLDNVKRALDNHNQEENDITGQLQAANEKMLDFKESTILVKQNAMGLGDVLQLLEENFDSAGQSVQGMKDEMDGLSRTAQTLNNIKSAVAQWFGFNEVINFTKRQISEAIQVIRDLDSAMTEIAVVTDMTQSDLWSQMDTYKSLAQQYGTTIKGVYEVSQLYY